jgi:hypothetical protein
MKLAVPILVLAVGAWAAEVEAPGVPNFHRVNDQIYRGGQPSRIAWNSLADLGIKLVIDLRPASEHPTSAEAQGCRGRRYALRQRAHEGNRRAAR